MASTHVSDSTIDDLNGILNTQNTNYIELLNKESKQDMNESILPSQASNKQNQTNKVNFNYVIRLSGINKNMQLIKIQENITRIKGKNLTVGNAFFNSKNNQFYILTNNLITFESLQVWPDDDEFGRLIKVVGKDNISKNFFVSIKGIDPGIDINKDQGIIEAFARVGIKKAMRLIKKKDNKNLSTI